MKNKNNFLNIAAERIPQSNTASPTMNVDEQGMAQQEKRRYEQDTDYRKHFSLWVMYIVPLWLILVIVLLYLSAFGLCSLSTAVMTTLLATTTANILGLAYIVLKGMFHIKK